MSDQTTSRTITFRFPFTLPGMTEPHAPGTFEVITDEEQLDVMWDARRSSTRVMLVYPGRIEAFPVRASDLEEAIALDREGKA
ncbi:hypothetical protein [Devosia sp. 1566]|uniref:hypothetical protein n=1 Tax=Devosia sp. 1566 TaxID=2499144 RepID=UPI000FDB08CC|nr:hypothetical protein [Devosia sp. 1566]